MTAEKPRRRDRRWGHPVRTLSAELVLIFPLFALYQAGVFTTGTLNGADLFTTLLAQLARFSPWAMLGLAAFVLLGAIYLHHRERRRGRFQHRHLFHVSAEGALWALIMGFVILAVMRWLLNMQPPGVAVTDVASASTVVTGGRGMWWVLTVSAGAGVNEELMFRAVFMGGGYWLLRRLGNRETSAFVIALLLSSALFSAVHHLPPHGDPWTLWVFTYRLLAGVVFGLLYRHRGLGVAVYTHFLYDVMVIGLQTG